MKVESVSVQPEVVTLLGIMNGMLWYRMEAPSVLVYTMLHALLYLNLQS